MRRGRERPGEAGRVLSTHRLLLRHLWGFLGCAAVGVALLTGVAVPQLDARAGELREEVAPSVRGTAAVRLAVLRADKAARASIGKGVAGTVGAGETAESQLAAADQSLTQLADHVGSGRDQDISAVNGLLAAYNSVITSATVKYQADAEMREEKLAEARALLERPETGLLARLDTVATAEQRRAGELSDLGVLLTACWVAAAAALAAAAAVAGLACRAVSRHCGRLLAPWILVGFIGSMALAALPAFLAWRTAESLDVARAHLTDILDTSLKNSPRTGAQYLAAAQQHVAAIGLPDLSAFGWLNVVYVVVGVAVTCAAVAGLVVRLTTDYPERPVDWSWARRLWNGMTRTRRRRRIGAAAVALAVMAAIVTPQVLRRDPVVTVLGPWTGKEEQRFLDLMDAEGIRVRYQGTPAQREVLLSRVQAGDPPDIAIMPGIGELAEYRAEDHLKPLDDLVKYLRYADPWRPKGNGSTYWWPVNANLKSIVWKSRDVVGQPASVSSWCLGMGEDGAAGWPGTDWIEDIVLQQAGPDVYADWARGTGRHARTAWTKGPVREAWRRWADFLATDRGDAKSALTADWHGPEALKPGHHPAFREATRCAFEHQGSFAQGDDGALLADSAPLLPGGPYRTRAYEVSGDFAALFNDREPARKALRALFSRAGQQRWADKGAMYSAMTPVMAEVADDGDVNATARAIYGRFQQPEVPRCLDASDVMRPAVRDVFYEAVLRTVAAVAGRRLSDTDLDDILWGVQKVQNLQEVTDQGAGTAGLQVCSEAGA